VWTFLRVAPDTKAFLREESSIEASERTADTEAFGLVSAATRFSVSEESGGLASSLASKDSPNQPMDSMQAIKKISWLLGTRSKETKPDRLRIVPSSGRLISRWSAEAENEARREVGVRCEGVSIAIQCFEPSSHQFSERKHHQDRDGLQEEACERG
jgi:hypothetical protein